MTVLAPILQDWTDCSDAHLTELACQHALQNEATYSLSNNTLNRPVRFTDQYFSSHVDK